MKTAFDIGMYDGADTLYYLESGFQVVAVEANPNLIKMAEVRFKPYIDKGALKLLNIAIAESVGEIELLICGDDLGSSSIFSGHLKARFPTGSYKVPSMPFQDFVGEHGVPDFLKIDIEGADKMCVLALTKDTAPKYLSFEAHSDIETLIRHAESIGYRQFKIINQCNFLCLQQQESLKYRLRKKAMRLMGYSDPAYVYRRGRRFRLGHSAGPAPWESHGGWHSADTILNDWRRSPNKGAAWYDVHAAIKP